MTNIITWERRIKCNNICRREMRIVTSWLWLDVEERIIRFREVPRCIIEIRPLISWNLLLNLRKWEWQREVNHLPIKIAYDLPFQQSPNEQNNYLSRRTEVTNSTTLLRHSMESRTLSFTVRCRPTKLISWLGTFCRRRLGSPGAVSSNDSQLLKKAELVVRTYYRHAHLPLFIVPKFALGGTHII